MNASKSKTTSSAVIDETGLYRYSLVREWDPDLPRIAFIMLNGSTADAEKDDPTLRRCIGFAKKWNFGSLEVVNLFGYRTTLPKELKQARDPIGPENDFHIKEAIYRAMIVVVAWGVHGIFRKRDADVIKLLNECHIVPRCLGKTKTGHPKHPLYLRGDVVPEMF